MEVDDIYLNVDDHRAFLKEATKKASKQIILAGRDPYNTYEFNSQRCQTSFDTNFNRDDPQSMLLFNAMHGGIILDKNNNPIIKDCEGAFLNKFSTAGMGQCSFNNSEGNQYIAYTMCDALSSGLVLDMPVIFRESNAHTQLRPHNTPADQYIITRPNIVKQRDLGRTYQNECSARNFDELNYDELLGDISSTGSRYLEKLYTLNDITEASGIYICKDWPEIGAKQMDNLLEKKKFITFILKKYIGEEKKRLTTTKSIIDLVTDVVAINKCMLSDVIEFCEKYGKHHISMVDDSCSVFESSTHPFTQRQIANIASTITNRSLPGVAIGVKRNKTKRNKTKRNKTKRKK